MNGRLRAVVPWLVLVSPLAAQSRPPFGYEHLRRVVSVAALDVSPDGRQVVFTVSRPNYTVDRTETSLWLIDLNGGPARPLTPGRVAVASPRWSPDGRSIAFQANPTDPVHTRERTRLWVEWVRSKLAAPTP